MKENVIQKLLTELLHKYFPEILWFAIPNGGYRNPLEALNLKRQGVLPGVSDLFIVGASKGFHGLFLELKTVKGKLSSNQLLFKQQVLNRGYSYQVARSVEEALSIICSYLDIPSKFHF